MAAVAFFLFIAGEIPLRVELSVRLLGSGVLGLFFRPFFRFWFLFAFRLNGVGGKTFPHCRPDAFGIWSVVPQYIDYSVDLLVTVL